MRILVCGSRDWTDKELMRSYFKNFAKDTVIIEGEARGADVMARELANEFGLKHDPYPAAWTELGKSAGAVRNGKMLKDGKPDMVMAFHDDLSKSKGTRNMVKIARLAGVPVYVIGHGPGNTSKPISSSDEFTDIVLSHGFKLLATKQYRFGNDFTYQKGHVQVVITKLVRGRAEWKVINTARPLMPLRGGDGVRLSQLLLNVLENSNGEEIA
jgi:hypothetical protein